MKIKLIPIPKREEVEKVINGKKRVLTKKIEKEIKKLISKLNSYEED